MRYKTKSADVLNEADRFENMLNWQLFCAEQNRLLWGPSPYDNWTPGTPIHKHPRDRFETEIAGRIESGEDLDDEEFEWIYEEGPVGNCARRMIEEFDDGDKYWSMRCEPCGVSWGRPDGDYCWMCGASYPWPELKPMKFSHIPFPRGESMGQVMDIETTEEGLVAYIRLNLENEMGARWAETLRRQMESLSIGMRESATAMGQAMRGFRTHMQVVDEAFVFRGNDRNRFGDHYHFSMPYRATAPRARFLPPTQQINPFEQADREIVLVESRIAEHIVDPPWSYGYVRLPRNVDLSGRRDPILPQMPEPRRFPDYRETYWQQFSTHVTQERRRR